jgi:hypothetical protein
MSSTNQTNPSQTDINNLPNYIPSILSPNEQNNISVQIANTQRTIRMAELMFSPRTVRIHRPSGTSVLCPLPRSNTGDSFSRLLRYGNEDEVDISEDEDENIEENDSNQTNQTEIEEDEHKHDEQTRQNQLNTIAYSEEELPNNYIDLTKRSDTADLQHDQMLNAIYQMVDKTFKTKIPYGSNQNFGTNISYELQLSGNKTVYIYGIVFEVNQISITGILIKENNTNNKLPKYNVFLIYNISFENRLNEKNTTSLNVTGNSLYDTIKSSFDRLQELKRCRNCESIYDNSVSQYCACCLFCDFYTKLNPLVQCIICNDKMRDFCTIKCGHRFCLACLTKVVKSGNSQCPLCRTLFVI